MGEESKRKIALLSTVSVLTGVLTALVISLILARNPVVNPYNDMAGPIDAIKKEFIIRPIIASTTSVAIMVIGRFLFRRNTSLPLPIGWKVIVLVLLATLAINFILTMIQLTYGLYGLT